MFDPDKVQKADMCDFVDPRGLFVRAEDYNQLLDLYRQLDAAKANETFLRVTDDALVDEQAHQLTRLQQTLKETQEGIDKAFNK